MVPALVEAPEVDAAESVPLVRVGVLPAPVTVHQDRELGNPPLAQPERDKARAIVVASRGIAESVDEARAYVQDAKEATAGIAEPELRAGLSRLVAELLSDLPS